MKTLIILGCMLAAGASPLWAQKAGDAGVGIMFGQPMGVTGKLWLNNVNALDAGVALNRRTTLYSDYLWHFTVLPQSSAIKLPVYLGLGIQERDSRRVSVGVRGVAGVSYWLPHNPVELFLELVPVVHLSYGGHVSLERSIGLRYYFKGF